MCRLVKKIDIVIIADYALGVKSRAPSPSATKPSGYGDIDTAYAIYYLLNKFQNPHINVLAISAQFGNSLIRDDVFKNLKKQIKLMDKDGILNSHPILFAPKKAFPPDETFYPVDGYRPVEWLNSDFTNAKCKNLVDIIKSNKKKVHVINFGPATTLMGLSTFNCFRNILQVTLLVGQYGKQAKKPQCGFTICKPADNSKSGNAGDFYWIVDKYSLISLIQNDKIRPKLLFAPAQTTGVSSLDKNSKYKNGGIVLTQYDLDLYSKSKYSSLRWMAKKSINRFQEWTSDFSGGTCIKGVILFVLVESLIAIDKIKYKNKKLYKYIKPCSGVEGIDVNLGNDKLVFLKKTKHNDDCKYNRDYKCNIATKTNNIKTLQYYIPANIKKYHN